MIAVACWALGVATGGALTAWTLSVAAILQRSKAAKQ